MSYLCFLYDKVGLIGNCYIFMKILMVCLGNICRSPLAEGIMQQKAKMAGLDWQVESAGTNGFHNGEAPHPLSQKIALSNGIDISHQRSRQLTKADFEKYDHIYAMAVDVLEEMKFIAGHLFDPQKSTLLLEVLQPGASASVPDPWYGNEDGYVHTFALINQACEAIIQQHLSPQDLN